MALTEDDVRRQLARLLASGGFANAGRMSRFLKFVVERTLAGEGERLKEYVIGVEVFDRDAGYDPRVDSIVRVEAARLRSKLAEYYAGEGRADSIVLTLPKGGYAPVIKHGEHRGAGDGAAAAVDGAEAPAAALVHAARPRTQRAWRAWTAGALLGAAATVAVVAWAPSRAPAPQLRVAVLPFEPNARDRAGVELAQLLTEGVTAELVRDGRFRVVASSAARSEYSVGRRPRDVAAALAADVVVEARIAADGERVQIEARAADGSTEQKLWVHGSSGTRAALDALERETAVAIAARLARAPIKAAR